MDGDDLELDSEGDTSTGSNSHPVRKNIAIKLKPSPKSRGRPKKVVKSKVKPMDQDLDNSFIPDVALFKTMEPLEPIQRDQRLRWDHRVNLIGEKVVDPVIHCCEKCTLPILIYGRMIPCKHVFCLDCAKKTEKSCARCEEPVQRVEQSALGTVFVCIYGGTKLGVSGCRRTYLSQRDLQAHVDHRHLKRGLGESSASHPQTQTSVSGPDYVVSRPMPMDIHRPPPSVQDPNMFQRPEQMQLHVPPPVIPVNHHPSVVNPLHLRPQGMQLPQTHLPPPTHPMAGMPPIMTPNLQQQPPNLQQQPPPVSRDNYSNVSIPVMTSNRGNLISVQIQDERSEYRGDFQTQPPPNYGHPPPVNFSPNQPHPTHHPPPGHYPQTTMTPPPRQPPPVSFAGPPPITHGPPPHYSTAQVSKPPPVSHPSVPPPLNHLQPHRPGGPLTSSPIAHHPRPGGPPPRMGMPPVTSHPPPRFPSAHPHYEDSPATPPYGQAGGQAPCVPWTGPPNRLPPPHTPVSSAPPNLGPPRGERPYKPFY